MAAATTDLPYTRQPGEYAQYTGGSGFLYYKGAMLMADGSGLLKPMIAGTSAALSKFLGINDNRVDLSGNLGSSAATLRVWKKGEFTLFSNGTGVSSDIGKRAYALDDQTVGISIANALYVGEITGIPTSTTYRIRIDSAINAWFPYSGLSGFTAQN